MKLTKKVKVEISEEISKGVRFLKDVSQIGFLKAMNLMSAIKVAEQKNPYTASILSTALSLFFTVPLLMVDEATSHILIPIVGALYCIAPIFYLVERQLNKDKIVTVDRYRDTKVYHPAESKIEARATKIKELKNDIKTMTHEKDVVAPVETNSGQEPVSALEQKNEMKK